MPSVNISFTERAKQSIERSERGIVALILKDKMQQENPITIFSAYEIPKELSSFNKEQIILSLMGYVKAPKKVIIYTVGEGDEEEPVDYSKALEYLETERFDYLAIPTIATDGLTETIVSWIKIID